MPPKNRDPNKPKGRMSSYAFFVQDRREMYKEKGMQVQFAAFSRECADQWKDMDNDDKKKYSKQADQDKARYQREMAHYKPPSDDEDAAPARRRRKKKDPNLPKRAISAKRPKLREQNPGAGIGEIAKQLGAAWKIMTPEQKAPYDEMTRKDRERYERQMELFRKGEFSRIEDEAEEEEDDDDDED